MDQMKDANGDYWGFPRMAPFVTYPVWVREDFLRAAGKDAPKTIDDLEEVMEIFLQTDPAGNGSTIVLFPEGLGDLEYCFSAGFTGKGNGLNVYDDGKVRPIFLDPKYKDFIAKMAEWYDKGYIYKETFSPDNQIREHIKKGTVAIVAAWYSCVTIQSPYMIENNPGASYVMCAPLTGPEGICESTGNISDWGGLVPAYSKKADLVTQFMDWSMIDIENHMVAEFGIKDVNWEYVDEPNKIIKTLDDNYIGEFVIGQGIATESRFAFDDPMREMHYDYIRNDIQNLDRAVKPGTFGFLYDGSEEAKAVPNREDIYRMKDEELIKFITGIRPMSEYDDYMALLYDIGADKLIDEMTRQYNLTH
jgi:hypothetical protein